MSTQTITRRATATGAFAITGGLIATLVPIPPALAQQPDGIDDTTTAVMPAVPTQAPVEPAAPALVQSVDVPITVRAAALEQDAADQAAQDEADFLAAAAQHSAAEARAAVDAAVAQRAAEEAARVAAEEQRAREAAEQQAREKAAAEAAKTRRAQQRVDRSADRQSAPEVAEEEAAPAPEQSAGDVISVARTLKGIPYVYGGTTKAGFDCSGFTRYVYAKLGKSLPRTAQAQANATTRISASQARPGDLVAFHKGSRVYHIGIYLGGGKMIASPRTGEVIKEQTIWSQNVTFHRV